MMVGTVVLPLVSLAQLTSLLVLMIFTLVNASLVVIKRRGGGHGGHLVVPTVVPYVGIVLCVGTVLFQIWGRT